MSEYWVSHKKYFCTYCKIYIADDVPSRQQHENGLRHKGNKERYVRSLYKNSEKKKQDLDEEKREMVRIDQAAQAAFAHDLGSGIAKPTASSSSASNSTIKPVAAPKPAKPSNPWANYSTAASLGLTDPDAERMNAEAERRRTQGVAGEWEFVSTPTPPTKDQSTSPKVSRKREAEGQAVDEEDTRHFKLRRKVVKGLSDEWDPSLIPIKLKPKKEESEVVIVEGEASKVEEPEEAQVSVPKWTSRGWRRPGELDDGSIISDYKDTNPPQLEELTEPVELTEDLKEVLLTSVKEEAVVKVEGTAIASVPVDEGGNLFRKRKFVGTSRGQR